MSEFIAAFICALIFVGLPSFTAGVAHGIRIRKGVESAMQEHIDILRGFAKEDRAHIRRLQAEVSATLSVPESRSQTLTLH